MQLRSRKITVIKVINPPKCFKNCFETGHCGPNGISFADTFQWCEKYQGPDGTDPIGTWVPFSLRSNADFAQFLDEVTTPQLNGCTGQVSTDQQS